MERGFFRIAKAARALRLSPWHSYAAAAVIFLAATAVAHLAQPAIREALFICYLPAIVLATLMAGAYAGLAVAFGGGLMIWYWLYPVNAPEDAISLTLYIDAAVLMLWGLDMSNRAFTRLVGERDRARLLFREAQHRTANNLMFISAFLRVERREAQRDPTRAARALEEAMHRLDTFSRIHRQLSTHAGGTESLPPLLQRLCDGLIEASGAHDVVVTLDVEPTELTFEQTMLLSLLLTEIVTNALKHAFRERGGGQISIRMFADGGDHILEVRDDGDGIWREPASEAGEGKGHLILEGLAAQLDGRITMTNDEGLRTRLIFPRHQEGKLVGGAVFAPLRPAH